ncbi:MAG TPA: LacI family DNA-binding transcriptional regulator [Mycobacteriales bacterium]|nr:LacI family DNA-binding transcriptional regulator [Mycobacteriales bacterium]
MSTLRSSRARPRPGAPVTLAHVAARAQVSLATASRVLNGSERTVGEELRERVLAAALELRYSSHGPAQALARATTSIVGLIVHDVRDPYFAAIAAGAMRVARDDNLMVMLASTFRDPELELDYLERLRVQRARAILLAGSGTTSRSFTQRLGESARAFEEGGGRIACVSHHGVSMDAILLDNRQGGRDIAQLLLDLGHREIGIVTGPSQLLTVRHRLDGASEALSDAGVPLPDSAIVQGDFSREGGRDATIRLLEQAPRTTAIFALNDLMARGVLMALEATGRKVPEDVSVVGFDDLPVAEDTSPRLTTVRLPLEEIGARAMRIVLEPALDRRRTERIAGEVVLRESTGPAPRRRGRN